MLTSLHSYTNKDDDRVLAATFCRPFLLFFSIMNLAGIFTCMHIKAIWGGYCVDKAFAYTLDLSPSHNIPTFGGDECMN